MSDFTFLIEMSFLIVFGMQRLYLIENMLFKIQNKFFLKDLKPLFSLVPGKSRFRRPRPGSCRDVGRNE